MKHACKVLERAWKSSGFSITPKVVLRAQQKDYYTAIALAKSQYFSTLFDQANNNAKEIFSIVKSFLSPRAQANMAPVSETWCNTLVNIFQDKITQIEGTFSIPSGQSISAPSDLATLRPIHSLSTFRLVDLDSSLKLLKGLKSGSPSDPCAARLLSDVADTIKPEVNCLINMSLQEAFVPGSWKQAHILPLLKKLALDPLVPANYRPIFSFPVYPRYVRRQSLLSSRTTWKTLVFSMRPNQVFVPHTALRQRCWRWRKRFENILTLAAEQLWLCWICRQRSTPCPTPSS